MTGERLLGVCFHEAPSHGWSGTQLGSKTGGMIQGLWGIR
jgi:hypothetical protein